MNIETERKTPLCPHCKGKCCRNDYGYRIEHQNSGYYWHECDYCEDGTKYVPPPDYAQLERDGIVVWMRRTAERYAQEADLVGDGYAVTWRIIAEQKADKEHGGVRNDRTRRPRRWRRHMIFDKVDLVQSL